MARTSPIPVRLDEKTIQRIDKVADRMGNTRAGVIKLCLQSFLESFEKKGTASLPLQWEEVLESLDGRTVSSRQTVKSQETQDDHDPKVEEVLVKSVAHLVAESQSKKVRKKKAEKAQSQ